MVKKSQNQDILHFVFHCVRIMSGYFRNFNPPSPLIHLGTPYLTPKAQKSVPMNLRTVVMFTMKFLWSGPCSYLSDIDDNSKFITRNVRILAYFLSGFCQDCQDIKTKNG